MRCIECETDPLTPGHYCECCGRKLSVEERSAVKAGPVVTAPVGQAFESGAAAPVLCESCGGPCEKGDLCRVCREAFSSLLGSDITPPPPTEAPAPAIPDAARPVTENLVTSFDGAADYLPASAAARDSRDASIAEAAPATPAFVPPPPPLRLMEQPRIEPGETARVETERAAPRKPKPAANSRTGVSYSPPRRFPSKLLAAAAVLLAVAVGLPLGARWLDVQGLLRAGSEAPPEQAVPVEASVTAEHQEAPSTNRPPAKAAAAGKPASGGAAAKPRPSGAARAPAKSARPSGQPGPQATPVSSPPAPEAEAPVEPPQTAVMAAAAAPVPAPTAPTGKFFEPTEVDEPPQVASRVEPRLPPDLPQLRSDLVVVRVLVSQSGHPFRVSLLRKSRLGRALDEAVIEAVTQWTFAPARKRGEAVNAWYHIGVPLGGGD